MLPTRNSLENYWKKLGPGLVTGAADDDPSGIATYSQAGARYGFGLAWMAIVTFPIMAIIQEMCARIGLVTGRGLAANIKRHYSKSVLFFCTILLLVVNTVNIGADLGAMAASVRLLAPSFPFIALVILFAIVSLILQIFVRYAVYVRYLKYLTFSLFAYVIAAFAIDIDWATVGRSIVFPKLEWSREYIFLICGVVGTTISPYLFFWQTGQEIEEEISRGDVTIKERQEDVSDKNIRDMRTDVWSGMLISNVVMFFIIIVSGATIFTSGITNIQTATDAALALKPFAGNFAFLLFSLGIIGTGLLAIPVLAGASSYAISESLGWRGEGLNKTFKQAHAFYGVLAISIFAGLIMNLLHIDPIRALLYTAVLSGMIAPVMIFFILRLSSDKSVMGPYVNKRLTTIVGWIILLIMVLITIATILSLLF